MRRVKKVDSSSLYTKKKNKTKQSKGEILKKKGYGVAVV